MKKVILFALAVIISLSSAYGQQEKMKKKVLATGSDYQLMQIDTYKDKELLGTKYELAGSNYKYPLETEYKKIFAGDLSAMKMMLDSAYKFLLTCDEKSRNMYSNVQFVAIPKIQQGTHMMILPSADMMHIFQKAHLEKLLKTIQKVETNK